METGRRIRFTSSLISDHLRGLKQDLIVCMEYEIYKSLNSNFPQESNVPSVFCPFSMHLWIIQNLFIVYHAVPRLNFSKDFFFTRPGCCMDADGLFIGEATLRKIFCLQETLRGVWGRQLIESLLQPDRVLFLPSPLLQEKTAASQTLDKSVRSHLTPTLPQHYFANGGTHTHTLSTKNTHTSNPCNKEILYRLLNSLKADERWSKCIFSILM